MKKSTIFMVLAILLVSCSQDNKLSLETQSLSIVENQKQSWRKADVSEEIIENQKKISHYDFDLKALQELIDTDGVSYVWFDLGLNEKNQMTISATGENYDKLIIKQVTSTIISSRDYSRDFQSISKMSDALASKKSKANHMLTHSQTFAYLNGMSKTYTNYKESLLQEGEKVRRFGMDALVVRRMLMTENIASLGLFLGVNEQNKTTTVFIGKDVKGNLLLNNSRDMETTGSAFDFTDPCPNTCDDCRRCVRRCDSPWWMCCIDEPCPGYEDEIGQ